MIVPIFYTKVLSLLWNSCCFIVALLKFLFFFERRALFLKSPLPRSPPRLTLLFLLLQPPTTSSPPSTHRSPLTCGITRDDTTTSLTRCTPCTGKSTFSTTCHKSDSQVELKVVRSSWCKWLFPIHLQHGACFAFLTLPEHVSRRWWELSVRQVQYQKQMTTCWLPKWIINAASKFPLCSPCFRYSLIMRGGFAVLAPTVRRGKRSDAWTSLKFGYWDPNWENLSKKWKDLLFQ